MRRRVQPADQLLIARRHHRRKLKEIADQDDLHAAERQFRFAIDAQKGVHAIEHVRAHHRDLVDDQQVERFDHFLLVDLANVLRHHRSEWKTAERMDGLPARIQRGHAGRREDHRLFLGKTRPQFADECRLSRACAAGHEDDLPAGGDGIERGLQLRVDFDRLRLRFRQAAPRRALLPAALDGRRLPGALRFVRRRWLRRTPRRTRTRLPRCLCRLLRRRFV